MLQVIFLIVGICVVLLAIAFAFKKYARVILWSGAIALFSGTLLLVGFGVINPVSENETGSSEFWGTVITLISSASLIIGAEALRKEQMQSSEDTLSNDEGGVVLPRALDTELARKIFSKAIEAGYMVENGSHYKWNESKVLLAYMCGRIYCGDKTNYSKLQDKGYWKFGGWFFPDTELNNLFDVSGLGQSRANRKDLQVPIKSIEIDNFFE